MKTIAYIDGQNFLYKISERLIDLGLIVDKSSLSAIDIPYLLQQIIPDENLEIRYYGVTRIKRQEDYGPDILQKSIDFANNLRKLRNCLKETGVEYRAVGILRVRNRDICKQCGYFDYKYQEKGVDVGLAVDLVKDALTKEVDHVILVSSDTDLIPALKIVRDQNIEMTYLAFGNQVIQSISRLANTTHTFRNREIAKAFERVNSIDN